MNASQRLADPEFLYIARQTLSRTDISHAAQGYDYRWRCQPRGAAGLVMVLTVLDTYLVVP